MYCKLLKDLREGSKMVWYTIDPNIFNKIATVSKSLNVNVQRYRLCGLNKNDFISDRFVHKNLNFKRICLLCGVDLVSSFVSFFSKRINNRF